MRLAIIVPYRDRRREMDIFIPHIENFLTNKQIDYKIFIAEQSDDKPFNYGKLCNATVNEIKDEYDYFCFHDIDILPINDDADYSYKETPTQIVSDEIPYDEYFGGITIFSKDDFLDINGFSNDYWGKGYVDLDLLHRCLINEKHLIKKYDYNNDGRLNLDLKDRNIIKKVSEITIPEKSIIANLNSDVLSKNFTVSFYFSVERDNNEKIVILRTLDRFDQQLFIVNNCMIYQFFDSKVMFQIDFNDINLKLLNHFTLVHDYDEKNVTFYMNGKKHVSKNYTINFNFTNKNVILGDVYNNNVDITLIDFKIFLRTLTENEIVKNYYYGIESDCLEFNKVTLHKDLTRLLDYKWNVWEMMSKTTTENEDKIVNEINIKDNISVEFNTVKMLPNRIKSNLKFISEKFEDIEDTYDPDIVENRKTYYNDLLGGKINTKKYGFKTVKYTLLNKTEHNDNTEWLKIVL